MGTTYGYARVSSRDQNLDRQFDALEAIGVARENIFFDKASGKDFNRPMYRKLVEAIEADDVLVIKSIDRLGRNYAEILEEWRLITKVKRAAILVLDMPLLDTRREREGITGVLIADIVLQLLSYVAQVERDNIRQRQAEGIAAAKARGVRFGRPRKKKPASFQAILESYLAGDITRIKAAQKMDVSVSTFDRWVTEVRKPSDAGTTE